MKQLTNENLTTELEAAYYELAFTDRNSKAFRLADNDSQRMTVIFCQSKTAKGATKVVAYLKHYNRVNDRLVLFSKAPYILKEATSLKPSIHINQKTGLANLISVAKLYLK